ncbi:MAG: EamA family transporter, partial [Bacteroidota bacterium]
MISLHEISVSSWIGMGVQICFGSILAYTALYWLLKVRPPLEVSTMNFVQPVVAVSAGVLIGKEQINTAVYASLGLTLLAVYLVRMKGKRGLQKDPKPAR